MKNFGSIVPECQCLAVGDEASLHLKAPGIPVAVLRRERHICFGVVDNPGRPVEKLDPAWSWSVYIERTTTGAAKDSRDGSSWPSQSVSTSWSEG